MSINYFRTEQKPEEKQDSTSKNETNCFPRLKFVGTMRRNFQKRNNPANKGTYGHPSLVVYKLM